MVVNPFAEWLVDGADAADNRTGLPRSFVHLFEDIEVGEAYLLRGIVRHHWNRGRHSVSTRKTYCCHC